ncbi:MAG TPA: ribosomal protein S18-alanine N-acetyltransferase [Methylomirabilota bacterium]|nr:ribosomal protein S18-alanine N-acetyltransferase [Methylomirabilota bacterium]
MCENELAANFRVRAANIDDLVQVCEIEEVTFSRDPYPRFLFERLLNDESCLFYVATIETDEVIGYLVSKVEDHSAHLLSLAILPAQRRLGAATRLLEELIAASTQMGIHEIRLEVRPDNWAAIQLYSQFHFSEETLFSQYYSDGSPALFMRRVNE